MGTTYIIVNDETKIAYELGKFTNKYLLQCPITLDNVYGSLTSFNMAEQERIEYAQFMFNSIKVLNPKFKIVDDGDDSFLKNYGDYIMVGSRYTNEHNLIINKLGSSHKSGVRVYYGISVRDYTKRHTAQYLNKYDSISHIDISNKSPNIGIKSNVFYSEDFDSYFALTEEQKTKYSFFYFVVPIQTLLNEKRLDELESPYVYIGAYAPSNVSNFISKVSFNYFDTYEQAQLAKDHFYRNL